MPGTQGQILCQSHLGEVPGEARVADIEGRAGAGRRGGGGGPCSGAASVSRVRGSLKREGKCSHPSHTTDLLS